MPSPPELHTLTSCDTVSSFAGKGKKRASTKVRDSPVMKESVQVLGDSLPLSELSITKLEEVVCKLYNGNQYKLVNDLRYKLFYKGKIAQSHQLPPASAVLHTTLSEPTAKLFSGRKPYSQDFSKNR